MEGKDYSEACSPAVGSSSSPLSLKGMKEQLTEVPFLTLGESLQHAERRAYPAQGPSRIHRASIIPRRHEPATCLVFTAADAVRMMFFVARPDTGSAVK